MVTTASEATGVGFANPDVLVDTQWVADHHADADVRVVESDEDILLYDIGHIPGPSSSTGTPTCRTRSGETSSTGRGSRR